jgi:hypothetical protein
MNYDCILINGDSYSAPEKNTKVYGDFLSDHFGIPVNNFAVHGSNNDRILRSSIEYLHEVKSKYNNPLVIIGWSFIRRMEVWYNGGNQSLLKTIPDSDQSRFITLDWILNSGEATLEQKALLHDEQGIHKQLMDFYTNLYLFARTLESQNVAYKFFSAAKNTPYPIGNFSYLNSLEQVQWVVNNTNIFKLHDFCISDWAKENDPGCSPTGHLSEVGHNKFACFIRDNLLD